MVCLDTLTLPAGKSARAHQEFLWIQLALQGNAKAHEQLLQRYRRSLQHLVLKMVRNPDDAQDLTIEIFARAFRHLAHYKPDYAFSTWLFRIATNCCIDFIGRKRLQLEPLHGPRVSGQKKGLWEAADQNPDPQALLIRQQRIELVQQVVNYLPSTYASLVRLRYFDELRYGRSA